MLNCATFVFYFSDFIGFCKYTYCLQNTLQIEYIDSTYIGFTNTFVAVN